MVSTSTDVSIALSLRPRAARDQHRPNQPLRCQAMATGSADIRDRSAVVRELRRTRTARRLGDTEWFDVAYRVYLFALGGLFVVVWLSDIVDGLFEREYAAALVAMRAPALPGLAPALARSRPHL